MPRGFQIITNERWMKDSEFLEYYKNIKPPKRSTSHSAGYDIFAPVGFELAPGEELKIPTGIKAYMESDEFLMIVPRSGLGFKYYTRLANTVGIIDSDYYDNEGNEGHIWVKMRNEGDKPVIVNYGEAFAQAIFQKYLLTEEDEFEGRVRVGGFGSTG